MNESTNKNNNEAPLEPIIAAYKKNSVFVDGRVYNDNRLFISTGEK